MEIIKIVLPILFSVFSPQGSRKKKENGHNTITRGRSHRWRGAESRSLNAEPEAAGEVFSLPVASGRSVIPGQSMFSTVLPMSRTKRQAKGRFPPKCQRSPALGLVPTGSQGSECPSSSFPGDGEGDIREGLALSKVKVTPKHALVFNVGDTTWNQNVLESFL